jgi:hypothetical protein
LFDPLCVACVFIFLLSSLGAPALTEPAASRGGPRTARSVRPSRVECPEPLRACGPFPRGRAPNCSGRTEPSISEGGKLRGRNGRLIWPCRSDFYENRKGSFTCRKYTTRDPQLYFPSEGRHVQDFLRPGLNLRCWVPEASMLTTRPPKPLLFR